jgi:hypothetical protein
MGSGEGGGDHRPDEGWLVIEPDFPAMPIVSFAIGLKLLNYGGFVHLPRREGLPKARSGLSSSAKAVLKLPATKSFFDSNDQ